MEAAYSKITTFFKVEGGGGGGFPPFLLDLILSHVLKGKLQGYQNILGIM